MSILMHWKYHKLGKTNTILRFNDKGHDGMG